MRVLIDAVYAIAITMALALTWCVAHWIVRARRPTPVIPIPRGRGCRVGRSTTAPRATTVEVPGYELLCDALEAYNADRNADRSG